MDQSTVEIKRRLYPASQVRELDRIAIEDHGIPGIELMHRAGRATWQALINRWPDARQVLVVCGAGNNAGDGYVIARCAIEAGLDVRVVALIPPKALKGDAGTAAYEYLSTGNTVATKLAEAGADRADVVVDAIFGTGLDRDVSGEFQTTINKINQSGVQVISVDIPSGINADTGTVMGSAVKAECTVTFIGHKQGLYSGEAADYRGSVIFSDLDIPPDVYESVSASAVLVDISSCRNLLPARPRTGHKGHYGHVLVVGGDYGFAGAVRMSGEAAARTGAGLVSIATRAEHAYTIPGGCPELMAAGVTMSDDIQPLVKRASVIAIGPGLGQSEWSRSLMATCQESGLPLVVDADALNLLAREPVKRDNWVLTPHPGEAARLLDISTSQVQSDRIAAAATLRDQYGGVIVLKGAGTIIAARGGIQICNHGNPGMATGGMGDSLTGVISGLIAQGLGNDQAAAAAVCIHARAADISAAKYGERGMMASDLLSHIRTLVNPGPCS